MMALTAGSLLLVDILFDKNNQFAHEYKNNPLMKLI